MIRLEWKYDIEKKENIKVEVYKNLRNKKWSIRAKEGQYKGRVIAHAEEVWLGGDVVFKVNERGRDRVREKRRKEVHAVVEGILISIPEGEWRKKIDVYYDPYVVDYFANRKTGEELRGSYSGVKFEKDGKVYIMEKK